MKLTDHEKNSALWKKLRQHAQERVDKFRADNDKDLSERDTQKLRGRIAEARHWLELETPPPTIERTDGFPED